MGQIEGEAEVSGVAVSAIPAAGNGGGTGADLVLIGELPAHSAKAWGLVLEGARPLAVDVDGDGVGVIGVVRLRRQGGLGRDADALGALAADDGSQGVLVVAYLNCTDRTQAYCVDGEHQPTDLAVGSSNPLRRGVPSSPSSAGPPRMITRAAHLTRASAGQRRGQPPHSRTRSSPPGQKLTSDGVSLVTPGIRRLADHWMPDE
jgi:hypothetical protein